MHFTASSANTQLKFPTTIPAKSAQQKSSTRMAQGVAEYAPASDGEVAGDGGTERECNGSVRLTRPCISRARATLEREMYSRRGVATVERKAARGLEEVEWELVLAQVQIRKRSSGRRSISRFGVDSVWLKLGCVEWRGCKVGRWLMIRSRQGRRALLSVLTGSFVLNKSDMSFTSP